MHLTLFYQTGGRQFYANILQFQVLPHNDLSFGQTLKLCIPALYALTTFGHLDVFVTSTVAASGKVDNSLTCS